MSHETYEITTLKFSDLAQMMNVSRGTICNMVREGLIREAVLRGDKEKCRRVDAINAFTGCLAAVYRKKGFGWDYVAPLCQHVRDMSVQQLTAKFRDGCTALVVVPGKTPEFYREGELYHRDPLYAALVVPILLHWHQFKRKLLHHATVKATVPDMEPTTAQ